MNGDDMVHSSKPAYFWTSVIAVLILYGLLYLAPLGLRPLFVPDESRYAQIPGAMVASGDRFTLHLAGLPYYEKPPLGYWLNAISISIFGRNAFAVRLPSALSAGLSALAVFVLMYARRKDAFRALTAAVVYLSCVLVFGIATFAVLDSVFSLFVCLSMVLFFFSESRTGVGKMLFQAFSGIACGAAFLTKGFTALIIPALAIAAWLLWEKRFRELARVWAIPMVAAAAFVLPLALAIHRANPDFWRYFFWVEHVQRFLEPGRDQHASPFWFFLPVLAVGAIPWSFFAPPVVSATRKLAAADSLTRYCLCWFATSFLFFSVCGGKLPTYILPCFPALAVITADALFEYPNEATLRRCCLVGMTVLAVAAIGFLGWLYFFNGNPVLLEQISSDTETIPLCASVFVTSICLGYAGRKFAVPGKRAQAIGMVAFSLCSLFIASFLFLPEAVEDRRSPSRLIEATMPLTPLEALIITDRITLPSVCWHYNQDDVVLYGDPGELSYGVKHSKTPGRYAATDEDTEAMIQDALENGRPVVMLVREPDRLLSRLIAGREPDEMRRISRYAWVLYE